MTLLWFGIFSKSRSYFKKPQDNITLAFIAMTYLSRSVCPCHMTVKDARSILMKGVAVHGFHRSDQRPFSYEKECLHKNRIQFPNSGPPAPTFPTNNAIVCHVQTKQECVTFSLSFLSAMQTKAKDTKHCSKIELAVS